VKKIISIIVYLISLLLISGCFIYTDPLIRTFILLIGCFIMYIGSYILYKNTNNKKVFKKTLIVWFIIYLIFLLNLTLFDNYFFRNENDFTSIKDHINIIPFKTIISYFKVTNVNLKSFLFNVIGNIAAFMPFAFFLPRLFERQQNIKNFIITMIITVLIVELLQLITLSGVCDIDDLILNVMGSVIMFKILKISKINDLLRKLEF